MNKKKLKGIIGMALAVSLSANSLSYATMNKSNEEEYSKLIKSIKSGNLVSQASGTSKIATDLDQEADEVVSVIVEFVSDPLALTNEPSVARAAESKVKRDHKLFEAFLSSSPAKANTLETPQIKQEYYTVYNGVAMDIKASDLEWLAECSVVKMIHKDYEVGLTTIKDESDEAEAALEIENKDKIIEEVELETPSVSEEVITLDSETNGIDLFMMDSLPFLDIDDLHNEGITGEGIKVGVLDTGIDYNHPDLTSAYKGFRDEDGDPNSQEMNSIKGWDFVDNDADPMETTYSDWKESGQDEYDYYGNPYYTSHGTHVSGTIAGQGENTESENSVLGVAPNVELYGYRVLGPRGSGMLSAIIAAIEKSVEDGMDVINLSLGDSSSNDPFNPMSTAVNNATIAGVVTVIANGNAGPNPSTASAPATAQLPISVGASNVDLTYDTYDVKSGNITLNAEVMFKNMEVSFSTFENKEYEYVYCGLGSVEDFADVDVKGKVALIDRGDLTFTEKISNAAEAGALFVMLANNVTDNELPYFGESVHLNTLALSLDEGQALKDKENKTITITPGDTILVEGDKLTEFSSVGPVTRTYEIRPDVVAPGSQVFSTVPEYINDKNEDEENYSVAYERMSGTSMATPHVAGIAALVLQANPDYTPEDVKAALMNTSEKITKEDGTDYSVHQIGAGRVNPYEAVHEEVSFKAEYEVVCGLDYDTYNNITGMLSYGRVYKTDDKDKSTIKSIPVTVTNNSNESKTYDVTVGYSNSERAVSAEENNVKLNVIDSVTVAPGESKTFDAEIVLPQSAQMGTYEGYIYFNDSANANNDYQMPFSVSLSKEGFGVLDYPAIGEDEYAKGAPAFNTSALFNKNAYTFFVGSDITFTMAVSEPVSTIHTFIKDTTTGEYIGHAGSQETSWVPEDVEVLIPNVMPGGLVSKIVNGNVTEEKIPMENGVYELEVVAETYEGKTFTGTLPVCIINDTKSDEVSFNLNEGIIEVNDDSYTTEVWYDGEQYEGLWIKANVFNEYIETMKNEYGLDYLKQEELNALYVTGYYPNGQPVGMGTMANGDGKKMVAGIEQSDLDQGFFKVKVDYANVATISDKPHTFIFVNEGEQYLSVETSTDTVSEKDDLVASISLNNVEDVTEGSFVISNVGDAKLSIESITPSKELNALLKDNKNSIDITFEELSTEYKGQEFKISFKLTGDNISGLNDDIKLFNVNYKVDEFIGVTEDLIDSEQYRYMTMQGRNGEFKNSNGETVNVHVGTIDTEISLESTERTLIFGQTSGYYRGMKNATIYAVDPEGNKYEPTHLMFDEWTEKGYLFSFNDLPVIDGDYKVILETPGGFDSIVNVPGSRLNNEDERIGNIFAITTYSYTSPTPLQSVLGDVNEDGAIDILDAIEVGKEYVMTDFEDFESMYPEVDNDPSKIIPADLTQDGIVNYKDMDLILDNYLKMDYSREDAKTPQAIYNGNDIYDILESCGYFDEQKELDVVLNIDKEELKVGEILNLIATPPTDTVQFDYEFSVREQKDEEWTVIQERNESNEAVWTPEKDGKYSVKVRIFYDEIDYIWQDNKVVTVTPSDIVTPEEPDGGNGNNGGNDGDDNGNSGDDNNNGGGSGDSGSEGDKPTTGVKPEENKPNTDNKLPQTGTVNGIMTLLIGATTAIGGALSLRKKK